MIEFLSTKLLIPRPRAHLVPRPRLTGRLNAGLDKNLTLIAAPAGFGKTTLLGEWIPQSPRCVTWLSLDQGDNDPIRFWAHVIASIQQIHPSLGAGALAQLQAPQSPPIPSILTALINDVTAYPDLFCTVLEDYHVIDFQPIHDGLTFLLDHLPANYHLVITTRADPPLPLARLRAGDRLAELRANDLRFTSEEAAAFLGRVMGLSLSAGQVAALEARTEGWIAGLQIAALSMQSLQDIPAFIESFSGSHRHILGYLAEEVLNQQPPATQDFLLQTSILNRLCGPLCQAVAGVPDAQAMLEDLERLNLFITALDTQARWYRFHQLFIDVLQVRLQRTRPEQVPELHRRAADWYARQGLLDEALGHALLGADYDAAAGLIEQAAGTLLHRGACASLICWLDALPEELIRSRPPLCMARAWTFHWGPSLDLERAEAWAQHALQAAATEGSLAPELSGEVAALQAMTAAARSQVGRSRQLAHQALDELPPESPWRCAMAFCLGTAYLESGQLDTAAAALGEALRLSQADGVHYVQLAVASFLADIQVIQGSLGRAAEMYRQVLAWSVPDLPQKGTVMAHGGLAEILFEQNQPEASLEHIQLGLSQIDQVGGAWSVFVIYRTLARLHQAQGDGLRALELLEQAYHTGQRMHVSLVVSQAAALVARLHLDLGDLPAAAVWAESYALSLEDAQVAHPGLHEAEYLTLARVLAAQGKPARALALLERLLEPAEEQGRYGSVIAILALQCALLQAQGDTTWALERLRRLLALAEPEGYVRIFVEQGEPMRLLLARTRASLEPRSDQAANGAARRRLAYTDRLLAAFSPLSSAAPARPSALVEPLSERELEVLRLIDQGLTNRQIAGRLVIAESTVKSHINHLYGKLGADRRTRALAIARELRLLVG